MPDLPQPGDTLGRYTITRLIGLGGMAVVHEARLSGPSGFEKQLALKILYPHNTHEPEIVSLFEDEARLGAALNHPSIVQVFDFGEADGLLFIAMELVDGWDLSMLLQASRDAGQPLGVDAVLYTGARIADALSYGHERQADGGRVAVVHRDLSPWNVLLSRAGELKLADFGLAKFRGQESQLDSGAARGRCSYMAPEQARSEEVDGRADVFSLGVLLYELLAGEHPFRGLTEFQIVSKAVSGDIPPIAELRPDCPPELNELLMSMLSAHPDGRPGNARIVRMALGRLLVARGRMEDTSVLYEELAPLVRHGHLSVREDDDDDEMTELHTMQLEDTEGSAAVDLASLLAEPEPKGGHEARGEAKPGVGAAVHEPDATLDAPAGEPADDADATLEADLPGAHPDDAERDAEQAITDDSLPSVPDPDGPDGQPSDAAANSPAAPPAGAARPGDAGSRGRRAAGAVGDGGSERRAPPSSPQASPASQPSGAPWPHPSFRGASLLAGGLYVLLGGGILAQGAAAAMAQYGVPEATRALPHYADAITWVYLHMTVLGLVMAVVGWTARAASTQRAFARLMVAAHAVYGFLDLRSSEPFGNGLYEGPQSAMPAFICVFVLLLFLGPAWPTKISSEVGGETPGGE